MKHHFLIALFGISMLVACSIPAMDSGTESVKTENQAPLPAPEHVAELVYIMQIDGMD